MTELLTPLCVIVAFVLGWVDLRSKAAALAKKTEDEAKAVRGEVVFAKAAADFKLGEIHVLVNARLTEALAQIEELEKRLSTVLSNPERES